MIAPVKAGTLVAINEPIEADVLLYAAVGTEGW
jgi:hypothetical protein